LESLRYFNKSLNQQYTEKTETWGDKDQTHVEGQQRMLKKV